MLDEIIRLSSQIHIPMARGSIQTDSVCQEDILVTEDEMRHQIMDTTNMADNIRHKVINTTGMAT
jgi:hypothetical protein